jgi:hypothetical protein
MVIAVEVVVVNQEVYTDKISANNLLPLFQNIATSSIQILSHNRASYEFSSGLFDMRGLKCPPCMQINYGMQICMQDCHKLNRKGITILLIRI